MSRYYVYRHGSNAANQPMEFGPVHVATVQAASAEEAIELALFRVRCYANQYLSARLAEVVEAKQAEIDLRVEVEGVTNE